MNAKRTWRFVPASAALFVALLLCGCIQTKDQYTINPDGSGKVTHEATMQPLNLNLGQEKPDPATQLKDAVRQELEKCAGVDAWKDVAFRRTDDGRIWFKGTAYFRDLGKLKFHNGGFQSSMGTPKLSRDAQGRMVLELVSLKAGKATETPKPTATKLSEEEIARKVQEDKAKYQQFRPMLVGVLSTMKQEESFQMPGQAVEVNNLKTGGNGDLSFTFDGAKLLTAVDEMTTDEAWWREQAIAGKEFGKDSPADESFLNEKLFGQKGPIRAVVAVRPVPLFPYEAEVAVARQNYPTLLKTLGIAAAIPAPVSSARGGAWKSLAVGGVQFVGISDQERWVRPFNRGVGYTLAIVGELPGSVLDVSGGQVTSATADNGDDLLPQRESDRTINFPSLSKDKTTVVFDVPLAIPGKAVQGLKEVSGTIAYSVGAKTKPVDLGITDFIAGAQGKEFEATIKAIKESEWHKGQQAIELQLKLPNHSVQSVDFYGPTGAKLDVTGPATTYVNDAVTILEYSVAGRFPAKGRIVVNAYQDMQKYQLPFNIRNVSLLGQPQ